MLCALSLQFLKKFALFPLSPIFFQCSFSKSFSFGFLPAIFHLLRCLFLKSSFELSCVECWASLCSCTFLHCCCCCKCNEKAPMKRSNLSFVNDHCAIKYKMDLVFCSTASAVSAETFSLSFLTSFLYFFCNTYTHYSSNNSSSGTLNWILIKLFAPNSIWVNSTEEKEKGERREVRRGKELTHTHKH